MVAAEIVVVAELAVVAPDVPVARRADAVQQRTVVQHRQVETAAVPRHQGRRVTLHAVEEALDQLGLVGVLVAQRPDAHGIARAEHHRDGDDALQVMGQEIAAGLGHAQLEHGLRDIGVGKSVEIVKPPAGSHVGDGLDVEDHHVHAGNTPVEM